MTVGIHRAAGLVIVAATQKRVDRALAESLQELRQPVSSGNESQQSLRKVFIETFAWIAGTALVWGALAISL
jgi:hypothetical protein